MASSSLASPASTLRGFVRHLDGFSVPHPAFPTFRSLLDDAAVATLCLCSLISAAITQHTQRQRAPKERGRREEEGDLEEELKDEEEEDGRGVELRLVEGRLRSGLLSLQRLLEVDLSYLSPAAVVRGDEEQTLWALQMIDAAIQRIAPLSPLHSPRPAPSSSTSAPPTSSPSPSLSFHRVQLDAAAPATVQSALDEIDRFLRAAATAIATTRESADAQPTSPARTKARTAAPADGPPPRSPPPPAPRTTALRRSRSATSAQRAAVSADNAQQRISPGRHARTGKAALQEVRRAEERPVKTAEEDGESGEGADDGTVGAQWSAAAASYVSDSSDASSVSPVADAAPRSRLLPLARRLRESSGRRHAPSSSPFAAASTTADRVGGDRRLRPSLSSSSTLSRLSASHRRHALARLRGLRAALTAEEEEEKRLRRSREADLHAEELRREMERRKLEADAVERCLRVAMGRGRREEREIERAVDEQARRVQAMMDSRREALQLYYQQQVQLLKEKAQRDEEERRIQRKVDLPRSTQLSTALDGLMTTLPRPLILPSSIPLIAAPPWLCPAAASASSAVLCVWL